MARPRIEINWIEFDKLCFIQATRREVASWFECSEDTIDRACEREKGMNYASYFEEKAGKGKISLRRKQFEMAMEGDRVMLIWLGKQYLGQADKMDQSVNMDLAKKAEEYSKLSPPELLKLHQQEVLRLTGEIENE